MSENINQRCRQCAARRVAGYALEGLQGCWRGVVATATAMLLGVYVYNIIYISKYSHIVPFTFFDNRRHRRGWQRLIRNYGWIYSLGRSFFRLWSLPHSSAPASWRERAGEKYLYIYINAHTHTYITNNGGRRVGEVEAGDAGITVVKFVVFCSDVATGFVGINSRVGTGAAGVRVGIDRDSGCGRDSVREILLMIRWPANWQPHARRIISHCFCSGTKATHRRLVSLFTVLIPNPGGRPPSPLHSYPRRPP